MKALTIKQPWVGCIFTRGKDIENRSWSTGYRGQLVIHAGVSRSRTDDAKQVDDGEGDAWLRGHIIGVVDLVDCVQNSTSKWADKDAWHWLLQNPRMLSAPLPFKGRLGLWNVDESTLAEMEQRLMSPAERIASQLHAMRPSYYVKPPSHLRTRIR